MKVVWTLSNIQTSSKWARVQGNRSPNEPVQPSAAPVAHLNVQGDVFHYLICSCIYMPGWLWQRSFVACKTLLLSHCVSCLRRHCKLSSKGRNTLEKVSRMDCDAGKRFPTLASRHRMLGIFTEGWRMTISYLDSWVQFYLQVVILKSVWSSLWLPAAHKTLNLNCVIFLLLPQNYVVKLNQNFD